MPQTSSIRALGFLCLASAAWCCEDHAVPAPLPLEPSPAVVSVVETPSEVRVNRTLPSASPVELTTSDRIRHLRVFDEPLVPTGVAGAAAADDALVAVLERQAQSPTFLTAEFVNYLESYPRSQWAASLWLNLGIHYRQEGFYSRALASWTRAWELTRGEADAQAQVLASRALAELAQINAWVGRKETLAEWFAAAEGRTFTGAAQSKLQEARNGYQMMLTHPEVSFKCGPYAIDRIQRLRTKAVEIDSRIAEYATTPRGTNLVEVRDLAQQLGETYRIAKRTPGAALLVPCVVHWKLDHYSAILRQEGERYLVQDSTMDRFYSQSQWVTAAAIDAEASGYFLVRQPGALPAGWSEVSDTEGASVHGRGNTGDGKPPSACPPSQPHCPDGKCGGPGMPSYDFNPLYGSLRIRDTPLVYSPPRGPGIAISIAYNEAMSTQPSTFTYSNFGARWSLSWIASVKAPVVTGTKVTCNLEAAGGGQIPFSGTTATSSAVGTTLQTFINPDVISVVSDTLIRIERNDGSFEEYGQVEGAGANKRLLLTKRADAQGNAVTVSYQTVAQGVRISGLTDAIGQVTTFAYDATDTLRITKVTDPFGRFASFGYTNGQLTSITDAVGMTSSFGYQANSDLITSMTTPYGTTTFARNGYSIIATDPYGEQERCAFVQGASIPESEPVATVPTEIPTQNQYLNYRNGFYWDKKAQKNFPGDYSKAVIYHFLHARAEDGGGTSRLLESVKRPLTNRVWFAYQGQIQPAFDEGIVFGSPIASARRLDDGTSEVTRTEFNSRGLVAKVTDAAGRVTNFTYAANAIDLETVSQQVGGVPQILSQTTYNSFHQPLTMRDAAGQVTSIGYHPTTRMPTTLTNAKNETSTFVYDPAGNFVLKIIYPVAGVESTMAYDGFNRVRTVTGVDGYSTVTDYDNLNRTTQVTYPDGSKEQVVWDKLNPVLLRDRQGRTTRQFFNKLGQLQAVRDAQGRVTQYLWCRCGSLDTLIDPAGNVTKWVYDLEARLLSKTYADQRQETYAYQPMSGRLASITDALNQVKQFGYTRDGRISSVSYQNAINPTSPVSFSYDNDFGRLTSMSDGTGVTSYSYYPIKAAPSYTVGAGQVQTITPPSALANGAVTFAYDVLGRVLTRTINGVASSVTYDALGRMATATNALGSFAYGYVGGTGRLSTITAPFNLVTTYSYNPLAKDFSLASIANTVSGGNRSTFSYDYIDKGVIKAVTRQFDAAASTTWSYQYDAVDQVIGANLSGAAPKSLGFGYDPAGNRVVTQDGNQVTVSVFNRVNQLVTAGVGSALVVQGTTNEPASVQVNGAATPLRLDKTFTATIPAGPGQNTFTVTAKDVAGNAVTHTYQATVTPGLGLTYQWDANGNLLTDGSSTYTWDVENRLIRIVKGNSVTDMTYDGMGRRVRIVETVNGIQQSAIRLLWVGSAIVEIKDDAGTTLERYFPQGFQAGGQAYLYTRDHLGSIYEAIASTGAVAARYDYDVYGKRTKVSGSVDLRFGYTGHYQHTASGMVMTLFRAYDPVTGRWLSRDPIGEAGGMNLYGYVHNNPIMLVDPLGLYDGMGFWSYLACLNNCIQANDPIDLALAKALGLVAGMQLPKAWVAATADSFGLADLARAVRFSMGTPGASSTTTLPSALSAAIRGGGRTGLRTLGRFAAPVVVGYGLALAALEVACAAHCAVNCEYTPPLNFNPLNFF